MSRTLARINNIRVTDNHNLFILSTIDKNNRLMIKLFKNEAKNIVAGFEKSTNYKLEYSGYRWDADYFIKMIKKTIPESKFFDGWLSGDLLEGTIQMVENKDYNYFINYYISMGMTNIPIEAPTFYRVLDSEYEDKKLANQARRNKNKH